MAKAKKVTKRAAPRKAAKAAAPRGAKAEAGSTRGSNQKTVLAAFGKTARGIDEVVEKTGLTPRQVRACIDRLRTSGVNIESTERGKFQVR